MNTQQLGGDIILVLIYMMWSEKHSKHVLFEYLDLDWLRI